MSLASARGALSDKIVARLQSVFAAQYVSPLVPPLVYTRRDPDLLNKTEKALNTAGIVVYVFIPEPKVPNPNLPGPVLRDISIKVRVLENPVIAKDASLKIEVVSELVLQSLHLWKPDGGVTQYLRADHDPITEIDTNNRIIEDVNLTAPSAIQPPA